MFCDGKGQCSGKEDEICGKYCLIIILNEICHCSRHVN